MQKKLSPKLLFFISHGYDLNINDQLSELSAFKIWDKGLQKYVYAFPLSEMDKVIALTGMEFNFDNQKNEIANVIQHSPALKEDIFPENYKGEGMCYIQRFPKIFIIKTILRKQTETFRLPVEQVEQMWKTLKQFKLNEKVKSSVLAEANVQNLGLTRFNRQTGSFDWAKFMGTRNAYFLYFYYPVKVLQDHEVIKYYRNGRVERIKEHWDLEGKLNATDSD